jgi:hypothetical protein
VSASPDRLGPFPSSFRCCPPDISSVLADHDEFFELPAPRGGGSPIQGFRSLLRRIMFSSRHSRMGTTVLLSQLSTTAELLVIDLVTQQDPESDPQLSCRCHFRFPQTFLHQLVLITAKFTRTVRRPTSLCHQGLPPAISF